MKSLQERCLSIMRISKKDKILTKALATRIQSKQKRIRKANVKYEKTNWYNDEWGNQGCVYFHENLYWGIKILNDEVKHITWTSEEWERRKNG